ncbi:MAG: S41 family peptidase [Bacteroidales bacterium]|nr:S41 family peptidase [Bacteroidales bacterium]
MKFLKKVPRKIKIILLAVSLIAVSVFSFSFSDNYFEISKNIDIFISLYKEVNLRYVDETNPAKLMETAIGAMLDELDPYTTYISESEIEDYRFLTTGQYGGIGALVQRKGDYIVIAEPYEGYPAQKNDLRAGDVVLEVDGKSVKGKNTADVSTMLKGQQGTTLKLLIKREGEQNPIEKTLVREEIKIGNIPYYGMINENTGYIRLSEFKESAGKEVHDALVDLKSKNSKLSGIIFDLRGNGGGLLKEAVNIANVFLKKGQEIVTTKGRDKEQTQTHGTLNNPVDTDIPLVILVNSGSASASEIVTGSIQDLDRGVIVGQRTYGKGLVQNVFPISYNSNIKITIAKYYVPSGRCIQAIDYSHRNEDGSVGKIPDSLMHPFKTKAGRIVYDGGGILPDVITEPRKISEIAVSLLTKQLIFDYATNYAMKHKSIPSAKNFKITDEIYNDFVAFLSDKEYDYKTRTEKEIEDFKTTATNEKYFDKVKDEYEALKNKLIHNKNEDLKTFKDEIVEFLKEEILSRYYYQKGRIEGALQQDTEIIKAIDVLNNKNLYTSILNGTYKQEKSK